MQTISKLLIRNNFTPQKPIYRAKERNEDIITDWLEKEYPKIKERAKKEGADIHWGDEMGVRSTHVFGRSYGIKNNTPIVKKTTKRFSCNMISSITNKGLMRFMIYTSGFNADVFLNFLRRLIYRQKKRFLLYLITIKFITANVHQLGLKNINLKLKCSFYLPMHLNLIQMKCSIEM